MKYKYINTNNINTWTNVQSTLDKNKGFSIPRELPAISLQYTADFFNLIHGKTIVECGTGLQGEMSGNSMLYWFNKTNANKIFCIDVDEKWIDTVKNKLGNHERIVYKHDDCFNVVSDVKNIDLIYMDFNPPNRATAYLNLFNISNSPKMILIDDTDHCRPWKQTLIVPCAVKEGYSIIYVGRQTLLIRGDIVEKYAKDIEYFGHE